MKEKQNGRQSNIELLRIVCIFLIIINHCAIYSNFNFKNPLSINALTIDFLHMGGKLAVSIFIFISGYFSCTVLKLRLDKIFRFSMEVFLYSLLLCLFDLFLNGVPVYNNIKLLLSIPYNYWEFVTAYFMLMFLSPWINTLLQSISIKSHIMLSLFLTMVWCVLPSFLNTDFCGSTLGSYVYIYITAAFIRRLNIKNRPYTYMLGFFSSYILIFITEVMFKILGVVLEEPALIIHSEHFRHLDSPFIMVSTIFIFLWFHSITVGHVALINRVASTSLAVFLLHDNHVLRDVLWSDLFQCQSYQDSPMLILNVIVSTLIIFAVCCCVDLIRQKVIEKKYVEYLPHLESEFREFFDKILYRFEKSDG